MIEERYTVFYPDKVFGHSTSVPLGVAVDRASGNIARITSAADMPAWIEAQAAEGYSVVEEVPGGTIIPGLADAHYHLLLYATVELLGAISMVGCSSREDAIKRITSASARMKDPEKPLLALSLDTSTVKGLTAADISTATGGRKAFLLDVSLHAGLASCELLTEVRATVENSALPRIGYCNDSGELSEVYTMKALEIVEAYCTAQQIESAIEKKLLAHLKRGMTTIHDLMPSTFNQFLAALRLRRRWHDAYHCNFPITRFYLNNLQYIELLSRMDELSCANLLTHEERIETIGLKVFIDGSFGAHTAKVDEPYTDTSTTGIYFRTPEQLDEDLAFCIANDIREVSIHCIGDAGCRRAIMFAKKCKESSSTATGHKMRIRIEHFQLPPTPVDETMNVVKMLGIWLCIQPNFLLDYTYSDRLGDRVRTMCPHDAIATAGVPFFTGTDGMPDSMMLAIKLATHAALPAQRFTLEKAITSASANTGAYENVLRGNIEEGFEADLLLVDNSLLDDLAVPDNPDGKVAVTDYFDLEDKIKRVYKTGVKIFPATKR